MILKIKLLNSDEWFMMDDIFAARWSKTKLATMGDILSLGQDRDCGMDFLFTEIAESLKRNSDTVDSVDLFHGDTSEYPFRTIYCELRSGKITNIAFDTECFLMNEEGKTVERIIVDRSVSSVAE